MLSIWKRLVLYHVVFLPCPSRFRYSFHQPPYE